MARVKGYKYRKSDCQQQKLQILYTVSESLQSKSRSASKAAVRNYFALWSFSKDFPKLYFHIAAFCRQTEFYTIKVPAAVTFF